MKRVKGLFIAPGQTPLDPVILGIIFLANVSFVSFGLCFKTLDESYFVVFRATEEKLHKMM